MITNISDRKDTKFLSYNNTLSVEIKFHWLNYVSIRFGEMKKISAKMFFTVVWSGVCQALGWFFGLFGYKRDGKFAKCVWGLFATSAAVVMGIIAIAFVYDLGDEAYRWYKRQHYNCNNEYCWANTYISQGIYIHNTNDGKGYIYNIRSGEKYLKHVAWIAKPLGKDSLVCFSNGKKRGYFNKNTGKVVVEPKYSHAWIFSDGLASVEEDGYIKFIDATGKVVIDKKMLYMTDMEGYVFHGGYCVVDTNDGEQCGLMDKKGNIVLPMEYSYILPTDDFKYWRLRKGDEMAVLDNAMFRIVYPKAWKSWTRRDDIISEIIIEGDSIKMDVGIVSYYPLLGEKLKKYFIEKATESNFRVHEEKTVIVDGKKGSVYELEDENSNICARIYWFHNGNKTVCFAIVKDSSSLEDFVLADYIRWKS